MVCHRGLRSPFTVGGKTFDSVTDEMVNAQKTAFGDPNDYMKKGGLKTMGEALERGVVLVMSIWDDHDVQMLWLDSIDPVTSLDIAPHRTSPHATRLRLARAA